MSATRPHAEGPEDGRTKAESALLIVLLKVAWCYSMVHVSAVWCVLGPCCVRLNDLIVKIREECVFYRCGG